MRTLIQLIHMAAGVMATLLLVGLFAWAYPLGRSVIEPVGYVSAAIVAAMGAGPLVRAIAIDFGRRR